MAKVDLWVRGWRHRAVVVTNDIGGMTLLVTGLSRHLHHHRAGHATSAPTHQPPEIRQPTFGFTNPARWRVPPSPRFDVCSGRLRCVSYYNNADSLEIVVDRANASEENDVSQPIFGDTEVQALRAIGFTEWESKAYLTLLDEAPATGYGIAKRSGVARARIYEVLDSLVSKGAARVSNGKPQKFAPTAPKEFLKSQRRQTEESFSRADEILRNFGAREKSGSVIWDLQGRNDIILRAQDIIGRASTRLLCEIWEAEADRLHRDLEDAAIRGVKVIVVAYGVVDFPFATVFPHPGTDEVTHGLGSRWLVVSADDREVVAGSVSGDAESRAAWTRHPGLVVPITELVRHDLYKLEMLNAHGDILEETFGPALATLRAKYRPLSW